MVSNTLLGAGAVLHKGEKLVSPSGKVEAILQDDGNFVVYVDKKDVWARYGVVLSTCFFSSFFSPSFSCFLKHARAREREP